MPAFRKDLSTIRTYVPGKPIEEVMREHGVIDVIKLASNECPQEPFPAVVDAVTAAAHGSHRYPDTLSTELGAAVAEHHGVPPDSVWLGPGSSSILMSIALAMGGPSTSAVFSEQSFVMYGIATAIAGAEAIRAPLDDAHRLDVAALAAAVRPDTTVLYMCNPNNPTGTYVAPDAIDRLVEAVPADVLLVIDEAYEEYVTHPAHVSALHHVAGRDNVVVTRTFSKVYGIAGLRVGYAIGRPATIAELRRTQAPFAVSNVGQAAAREALRHQDLVAERVKDNARGRDQLGAGLAELGVPYLESHTNFVQIRPPGDAAVVAEQLLHRGVIVRRFDELIRVTVGTEAENTRFLETLGDLLQ